MASESIACIDIGSSKICTLLASVKKGTVHIDGVGWAASRGIQKGAVLHIEDATRAIGESVDKALSAGKPSGFRRVVVGFSGKHVGCTNPLVSVNTDRRDHVVTELALEQADRQLEAMTFPDDRMKVNIVKRQYLLDRAGGIRNPLGMHGFRLDMEAHIVTANAACVENLALCVSRAGVPVSAGDFVANPLASSQAVLEPEGKEAGVVLADIGGGITGIALFQQGNILYTTTLPVGGKQITSDLAIGLHIPFSMAEELNLKCGSLYADGHAESDSADILERCGTSAEQVTYIVRSRMEEILRMIKVKLPCVPNTIVLTGGGAKLPGMERFAQEVLGLEARVGRPRVLAGDSHGLDDPAYSAALGLLVWGTGTTEIETNGSDGNGSDSRSVLEPVLHGLRSGWLTIWSRRPRVTFGPPSPPADQTEA